MKTDYNDYILVIHLLCWSQCSIVLQLRLHLVPISGEGRSMSGQRAGSQSVQGSCLESCRWTITSLEWGVDMQTTRWACSGPAQPCLLQANTVNSYYVPGMTPVPRVHWRSRAMISALLQLQNASAEDGVGQGPGSHQVIDMIRKL